MSLFRSSAARRATIKVLAWGANNAGKSHLLYSAPAPAVINWENRSVPPYFAGREFPDARPRSTAEYRAALAEFGAGAVACETVGLDSLHRPYTAYIAHYTSEVEKNGRRSVLTDFVAVNRRMLTEIIEPLCALPDVNIVAVARQGVHLEREGADFKNRGVKLNGDLNRWVYEFDYVLHYAGRGAVEVQKSMSEHLPVGVTIHGDLDWDRLMRLISGEEALPEHVAPRSRARAGSPPAAPPQAAPAERVRPAAAASAAPDPFGDLALADRRKIIAIARDLAHVDVEHEPGLTALKVVIHRVAGTYTLDHAHVQSVVEAIKGGALDTARVAV